MRLLALILGIAVATIGAVGVAAPSIVLDFGESLLTPTLLYAVAAARVVFGAALLWVAPASRTPMIIGAIGVLLILAGVLGPFIGIEHSRAMLDWLFTHGPWFTRAWASIAVLLGLFIVYAVSGPRRFAP